MAKLKIYYLLGKLNLKRIKTFFTFGSNINVILFCKNTAANEIPFYFS